MALSRINDCRAALIAVIIFSISSFGIVIAQERASEILRIINKTQIYCVSEERVHWPMFTDPPLQKFQLSYNLLVNGKWENDDWTIKDSNQIIATADIVDKRWEDFQINQRNYLHFSNLSKSLSFSVYGTNLIEFVADNGKRLKHFNQSLKNKQEWTTFSIFCKDDDIHFLMDGNHIQHYSFRPTEVNVKVNGTAYFKVHKYNYKEATTVANAIRNPTSLIIPPSDKSFLMLFVSLCSSCTLEVKYGTEYLHIISSNKETDTTEQWDTYTIKINSTITNKLQFIRKRIDYVQEGYWKLDVRLYDNEYNTVTYKIDRGGESDKEYHCKYLRAPLISKRKRVKRLVSSQEYSDVTNCPAGMIGSECDISCKKILGERYSMCDEHKICNSMYCECAWGYSGQWCDQKCTDGNWGLDCKETCTDCHACDRHTGKCTHSTLFKVLSIAGVLVAALTAIILQKKFSTFGTLSSRSLEFNSCLVS